MKIKEISWKVTIWAIPFSVGVMELLDWNFSFYRDAGAYFAHPAGRIAGNVVLVCVMFASAHWPSKKATEPNSLTR